VNRHDVQLLQSIQGYPALSILLPTHRTSPDNRQDPIRVKNLASEAADRLLKEFSKREIQPLLDNLDAIVRDIDYRYALDGLAIYVNKDFARKFYLPFPIKERVIIDESFATRDLVMTMNRSPRYWVLALSEKPTRLFEGARDTLVEITDYGFPKVHTGPGGEAALPGGFGVKKSAYRDEYSRKFFREVDASFAEVAQDDPLPLLLVGVDRHLSFFDEVTSHGSLVAGSLLGNHDTTSAHDLGKLLWPLVLEAKEARRQELLSELDVAVGAQRSASTLGEAWLQAQMGRVATLLVEEDYHQPARVSESGMLLTLLDEAGGPDVMEDAVDDLVELVLQKGGQAFFFGDGALARHGRVAAILRY
jgi:hypothetical protein